jgi:hypothetical protein
VFSNPKAKYRALMDKLAAERSSESAIERLCSDYESDIIFDRADWVSALVDTGNVIQFNTMKMTATRAITLQGKLIWLIRSAQYKRAYHSSQPDASSAIQDAICAWKRRSDMRRYREEVRAIVSDLRWGRKRFRIRVEDAYASPLCNEGVDGFLRSIGVGRFTDFPGWFIAWCFALDHQVGFVIWEAYKRTRAEGCSQADGTAR